MPMLKDMPADVELPPLRRTYAALVCRTVPPAPSASMIARWLESQLPAQSGVRVLSDQLLIALLNAESAEHGDQAARALTASLSKTFGSGVAHAYELSAEPQLKHALRPSGLLPPLFEDLFARLR